MADPTPDSTSLYKASLERRLAELAFLNANAIVSDADNAAMQNSLAAARRKLPVGKFIVTCAFQFVKKIPAQLQVEVGQQFDVLDDEDKDWYLGRVVGGNGVVGWAPKTQFHTEEEVETLVET
ncbi:hypothetical protein FN846DRAFT_914735 [Sphaerosporella brunnea]|uniref:SH3 domain-containing protein n=1 Tax=Sphaerosporella brunnea TaxID=1250544 RepID=A0A5J5EBJ4_9PEZI|nr:hypothetical protein FN846DRAFT_914735 [Sphaerosporella brunnea]